MLAGKGDKVGPGSKGDFEILRGPTCSAKRITKARRNENAKDGKEGPKEGDDVFRLATMPAFGSCIRSFAFSRSSGLAGRSAFIPPSGVGWITVLGLRPSRIWRKTLSNRAKRAAGGKGVACTPRFVERALSAPAAQDTKYIARFLLAMSYVDCSLAKKDLRAGPCARGRS